MLLRKQFRLITLGRLALLAPTGTEDPSLGKQRRKLAVLAVLALAPRPVARDHLIEMFWGDQEEGRARHSLSEALSHLRRVLGREAITLRQAEVTLSEDFPLRLDAREFAQAVAERRYGHGLELYGGPFLDGIYVGGSASFEHWVERERARLEGLFREACKQESQVLEHARRWGETAEVARRWLESDPLSSEAAAQLLHALQAPGTREADARAIEEYERLRIRLERDFGLAPEPPIVELAAGIRERLTASGRNLPVMVEEDASTASADSPPPLAEPAEPARWPPAGTEEDAPSPATEAPGPAGGAAPTVRRHRRTLIAIASIFLLVAIAGLTLWRGAPAPAPASPAVVAVFPFQVHGGEEFDYLGEGMVELLSINLDGAGALRSVDPNALVSFVARQSDGALAPEDGRAIAARFGAGLFVLGDVIEAGEHLRITATLYDQRGGGRAVGHAAVEGGPSELLDLVDLLTAQLLAAQSREPTNHLNRVAALTTSSLPALKSFLEGEEHYRAARHSAALEAFQSAVVLDSTFALAHYRLSQAANWSAAWPWDAIVESSQRAVRHSERLSRRARLLVQAFHAHKAGAYEEAEHLYRTIVGSYPHDVEAWFQLGEVLFHKNTFRGRSFLESREAFEQVLQLEPDEQHALVHLIRIAAREGRREELDALLARAIALTPGEWQLELRAMRAFALGTRADQDRVVEELQRANPELARVSAFRIGVYAGDLEGAERLSQLLTARLHPREIRSLGHLYLAEIELAHGRWRAADSQLEAAARLNAPIALEHRALLSVLPLMVRPKAELEALRAELAAWESEPPTSTYPVFAVYNGLHPHLRAYLLGVLSIHLGDLAAAERHAAALDAISGSKEAEAFARGLAASVRAQAAAWRGESAEALALLQTGRLTVSEGLLESLFGSQAYERFLRAELLREAGRHQEALAWYGTIADLSMEQLVFLAPAHLRQAEIYERLGQVEKAAEHYTRLIALWKDCDPELRPLVAAAAERLRRLQ